MRGNEVQGTAVRAKDIAKFGVANAHSILQHGFENRLQFARRTRNNAQHIRGRRLLLQRLAQFGEQPGVLDGDDRLVGEGLEQLHLGRFKRPQYVAVNVKGADGAALGPQRRAENGANPGAARNGRAGPICEFAVQVVQIRQMDLPVFANNLSRQVPAANGRTECWVGVEIIANLFGALADTDR